MSQFMLNMKKKLYFICLGLILMPINSIEDVFRLLNVWEDAARLREKGLSWSHVARELGYDKDRMHPVLQEVIEERLKESQRKDLITKEQLESKFKHFDDLALKWVSIIFTE